MIFLAWIHKHMHSFTKVVLNILFTALFFMITYKNISMHFSRSTLIHFYLCFWPSPNNELQLYSLFIAIYTLENWEYLIAVTFLLVKKKKNEVSLLHFKQVKIKVLWEKYTFCLFYLIFHKVMVPVTDRNWTLWPRISFQA